VPQGAFRRPRKGKSGGYRAITFFTGPMMPIFLLAVFSKGERSDLTQMERNLLRDNTKQIVSSYRSRVNPFRRK